MEQKHIELTLYTPDGEWPQCYYDNDRLCGDPKVGGKKDTWSEHQPRSWHVADMCECPSCPLRCAIRDAMTRDAKES